jgi:carbon-monoxide dehydrogenase large subunit
MPENKLRVIAPDIGGAFGNKADIPQGLVLTAIMAMRLGRPVKWIEDRSEHARSSGHGRGQIDDIEAAVMNDGRITGLKVRAINDLGAYYQFMSPLMGVITGTALPGTYDIPNVHFELLSVLTNTTPVGPYRGAGRPEATYLLECMMDEVAHALGQDPAEIRRRNFIPPETFPHTTALGLVLDSGDYEQALDRALDVAGYQALLAEQEAARARGELMGIGVASYLEICGFGPWESATVRVEPSGVVTAHTGTSPHGQGTATMMSQLIADQLGIDLDRIRVLYGDTAQTPTGVGTFGSRGAAVGGNAMILASAQVAEKVVRIAAHLLEVLPNDIDIVPGGYGVRGASEQRVSLAQVAGAAYGGTIPDGDEPGLEATRFFQPRGVTCPFGAHIAVVDVDRDTGKVTLRRIVAIDDCGPVINPLIAEGQRHGSIAQGVAQALFEEVVYDHHGQLVTSSLNDYAVPTASAFPMFELDRTETPSPLNPLGIKGIAESATIGSTPAVRNAVLDALRPLGISRLDMPFTPHKVWRAIQATAYR